MSDEAHLLAAIAGAPDDDTPRLVYADWLTEHDSPGPAGRAGSSLGAGPGPNAERAEFIRLQIGLSAGTIPEAQREEARVRADALFGQNQLEWCAALPRRSGVTWQMAPSQFDRGFAHGVHFAHGKAWRKHAEEVFAAAPVSRVSCGGTFTARTARPLFASPLLGRLAELRGAHLDAEGAEAMANNPHLVGRLRELQISGSPHADAAASALGRAAGLRNLETLNFGSVGAAGAASLAASPHLARLKDLSLHGSTVGDDGAAAIAASPHLAAVEHILLNHSGVGDRGAVALANAVRLVALCELYLGGGNPITDAGAEGIASSSGLPALADLHLWGSHITDAGARVLADFTERRGLRVLNFRACRLSAAVVTELTGRLGPRFCFGP